MFIYFLKVHKNENYFGSEFEFCSTSLLVMRKFLAYFDIFLSLSLKTTRNNRKS
jgi:hypothetical protein